MNDFLREMLSYGGLFRKMWKAEKTTQSEKVSYGDHKNQYFLHFEPVEKKSDKIFIWVHGGGWNSGSPEFFDFVGQSISNLGYRVISIGYRLSPKHKYPIQIEDVCTGFNKSLEFLESKNIDISKLIVSGPSAGAHLTALLCYSKQIQDTYKVNISNVIGFIGVGGPYKFEEKSSLPLRLLLNQLFSKDYDRKNGEPFTMINESNIPMLLIQSEHDGVINFSNAEQYYEKAKELGIESELYRVVDKKNTHSWYTTAMFLEERTDYKALNKLLSWIENL